MDTPEAKGNEMFCGKSDNCKKHARSDETPGADGDRTSCGLNTEAEALPSTACSYHPIVKKKIAKKTLRMVAPLGNQIEIPAVTVNDGQGMTAGHSDAAPGADGDHTNGEALTYSVYSCHPVAKKQIARKPVGLLAHMRNLQYARSESSEVSSSGDEGSDEIPAMIDKADNANIN